MRLSGIGLLLCGFVSGFLGWGFLLPPPPTPVGLPPRKVFHFLKEAGYGIGNMQTPMFWDDVDEQRGLLVVDVGACDGSDWAIPAANKRGHTVIAFEPMPANVDRLMRAALTQKVAVVAEDSVPAVWPLDGKVHLFAAAVSDRAGQAQMHSKAELASVVPQDFYPTPPGGAPTQVPVLRLDDVIRNQNIHLLKIDTQGNELKVLRGAEGLFRHRRVNIVQLEFWPKGVAQGGDDPVGVLDFLYRHGFMCFDYSLNRHIPASRPGDFEGFVASFDPHRDGGFGGWDELVCFSIYT
jgi:hypothetical protein